MKEIVLKAVTNVLALVDTKQVVHIDFSQEGAWVRTSEEESYFFSWEEIER